MGAGHQAQTDPTLSEEMKMTNPLPLITPTDCALLLADVQAGLAFGVGSIDRHCATTSLQLRVRPPCSSYPWQQVHRPAKSIAAP